MKAIQVKDSNRAAIEAALKSVNGNSTSHTYTSYEEIEWLVAKAEKQLGALMYKKDMSGVRYNSISGERVPNSYTNSRIATGVTLNRTSSGWSLVDVKREYLYNDPGKTKLQLQPSHERAMNEYLRKNVYDLVAEKAARSSAADKAKLKDRVKAPGAGTIVETMEALVVAPSLAA